MKKAKVFLCNILHSLLFLSCATDTNVEYTQENIPDNPDAYVYENISMKNPWGYELEENASKDYPLLVSGMWGEGQKSYDTIAKDYPAFVIDYQKDSVSDGRALANWIRVAIESGYRIDTSRIYLTGFSRGGSGSFPLAKGMNEEGMYFAAIIRVSGQSQSDYGNDIAKQTAVWYHIGLLDKDVRIEVAGKTLENMRNYECNLDAVETKTSDSITGYERTTVTLTRSGNPMFKYSEYSNMGHTPEACYTDDALFSWLFSHSLQYR